MKIINFIDTSVLLNILNVPGCNQDREVIVIKMKSKTEEGERFILPLATIIETGNYIAHIADESMRRKCAKKFADMLQMVLEDKFPWAYNKREIGDSELRAMINRFPDYVQQYEMGLGDLSMLDEYARYKKRNKKRLDVRIWSLDERLQAFSGIDCV